MIQYFKVFNKCHLSLTTRPGLQNRYSMSQSWQKQSASNSLTIYFKYHFKYLASFHVPTFVQHHLQLQPSSSFVGGVGSRPFVFESRLLCKFVNSIKCLRVRLNFCSSGIFKDPNLHAAAVNTCVPKCIDPFTERHKLVHNGGFPKFEALH